MYKYLSKEDVPTWCKQFYYDETFSLPTDAHNVKKHRVTKTF